MTCQNCGANLQPGLSFCTSCGAHVTPPVAGAAMKFCKGCGAPIERPTKFCEACGARIDEMVQPSPAVPSSPAFQPVPSAPPPGGAPAWQAAPASVVSPLNAPVARRSGGGLFKLLLAAGVVLTLLLVTVIGGLAYLGYRAKKKVERIQQAFHEKDANKVASELDLDKLASKIGADPGSAASAPATGQNPNDPAKSEDLNKSLSALADAASALVQKQGGSSSNPNERPSLASFLAALNAAGGGKAETRPAANCPSGDQDSFNNYVKAASSAVIPLEPGMTLTDIWSPGGGRNDVEVLQTVNAIRENRIETRNMRLVGSGSQSTRNLCITDMLKGREYETEFGTTDPDTIPGATMFSLSKAEFDDLKAGRPVDFTYYEARNTAGGYALTSLAKGSLNRVETGDVPYSAIVNEATKALPTIHAKGNLATMALEAWVLDDAANPLVLSLKDTKSSFHITYVKITFPVKKQVEQQLAQTGRAEIYGIYFDFNKATPRPESAPVLQEIATALKDNPAWKLKIEGHTDNIGGDPYNLELSQRRAEGIMQALVTQYGIAAGRLNAKGNGATQPKATNATVEGRALNRRVELVRE